MPKNLVGLSVEDVAYIIPGFNVEQSPEQIWKNYTERFHYWKEYPAGVLLKKSKKSCKFRQFGANNERN